MDPADFLTGVIRPTLEVLHKEHPEIRYDESVEELLLGTAVHESMGLECLFQRGGGPALGLYQIEPETHESIWDHYLKYRQGLASTVRGFASQHTFTRSNNYLNNELVTNLAYATVIARLVYLPIPKKIPNDLQGRAEYWDRYYNRNPLHGTPQEFVDNYRLHVDDSL